MYVCTHTVHKVGLDSHCLPHTCTSCGLHCLAILCSRTVYSWLWTLRSQLDYDGDGVLAKGRPTHLLTGPQRSVRPPSTRQYTVETAYVPSTKQLASVQYVRLHYILMHQSLRNFKPPDCDRTHLTLGVWAHLYAYCMYQLSVFKAYVDCHKGRDTHFSTKNKSGTTHASIKDILVPIHKVTHTMVPFHRGHISTNIRWPIQWYLFIKDTYGPT